MLDTKVVTEFLIKIFVILFQLIEQRKYYVILCFEYYLGYVPFHNFKYLTCMKLIVWVGSSHHSIMDKGSVNIKSLFI